MRVAYLILAHNEPFLLNLLVTTLNPSHRDIFIHLDAKSNTRQFQFQNILLAKKFFQEHAVHWGHVSMLNAILSLISVARNTANYDYYVLMSGVDFPTRPLDDFENFLYQHNGCTFQPIRPAMASFEGRKRLRSFYVIRERDRPSLFFQKLLFMQTFFGKWGGRHPPPFFNHYFFGSEWFTMHRDMAKWVLECWTNTEIKKYFSRVFCPEEIFIATAIANSPWPASHVNQNLRFIPWTGGPNPRAVVLDDLHAINQSGAFFARKMSSGESMPLLEVLARDVHGIEAANCMRVA